MRDFRIDVMSVVRGVAPFAETWERRTRLEADGLAVELMALTDLVAAKKTQRDKDWPMIRQLVASYFAHHHDPTAAQVGWGGGRSQEGSVNG